MHTQQYLTDLGPFAQAAAQLITQGYRVFPVEPDGKKPLILDWQENASSDEARIREWAHRWPSSRVGLPTGRINNIWVLDIDPEGFIHLGELGALPDTQRVMTPRLGLHFYFAYPKDRLPLGNRVNLLPGIDVRGDGGYVVAVGSSGYIPIDGTAPANAPADLLACVRAGRTLAPKYGQPFELKPLTEDEALPTDHAESICSKAIAELAAAEEGQRNHTLNRVAFIIAGACASIPDRARYWWHEIEHTAEVIGLDSGEIHATMKSGWGKGIREPMRRRTAAEVFGANPAYLAHKEAQRDDIDRHSRRNNALIAAIMSLDEMLADFVLIAGAFVVSRSRRWLRGVGPASKELAASKTPIVNEGGKTKLYGTFGLWSQDRQRLTVDSLTWQPGAGEFCLPLDQRGGSISFNTWRAPELLPVPPNWQEWAKPFIDHVAYLVPIEVERVRFLQWLAHILQKPWQLPHTAYLFVASTHGIGRGTLMMILSRVLRGFMAGNVSLQAILRPGGFNEELSERLLATVDEIQEGRSTVDPWKLAQAFKSLMTEETRRVNVKHERLILEKNCCRWLVCSNHFDAIPLDDGDRRVIVIENPSQPAPPEWFAYLHSIMDCPEFIGAVQRYLMTLDISSFKPGEHAPLSASKQQALEATRSEADRLARQFRDSWPGMVAAVSDLRAFMGTDAPSTSRAMTHVIRRAGMVTGHQIRIGGSGRETVLIVRDLSPDQVQEASPDWLRGEIQKARTKFSTI